MARIRPPETSDLPTPPCGFKCQPQQDFGRDQSGSSTGETGKSVETAVLTVPEWGRGVTTAHPIAPLLAPIDTSTGVAPTSERFAMWRGGGGPTGCERCVRRMRTNGVCVCGCPRAVVVGRSVVPPSFYQQCCDGGLSSTTTLVGGWWDVGCVVAVVGG